MRFGLKMPTILSLSITILALFQIALVVDARTHVLFWTVLPDINLPYQIWSSFQKFHVDDRLTFEFLQGQHTVAKVTKEVYQSCNFTEILAMEARSPAKFKLEKEGEHYFVCTVGRHCQLGQKVAINVAGYAAPEAAPGADDTPSPARPAGSGEVVTYVVGDELGWVPPPTGASAYSAWAFNKEFVVGDTLVFKFDDKRQDVALVSKSDYKNCNTNTTISIFTTSPARVLLTTAGEYYFTSTYPYLCYFGQRLAINVRAVAAATSPTPEGSSLVAGGPIPLPFSSAPPFTHAQQLAAFCLISFAALLLPPNVFS